MIYIFAVTSKTNVQAKLSGCDYEEIYLCNVLQFRFCYGLIIQFSYLI